MYYIDANGRLIFEECQMQAELIGIRENKDQQLTYIFNLLWEKND